MEKQSSEIEQNSLEAEAEEYYSDENVTKAIFEAKDFLENVFKDRLQQIEYLKLRQIAKEIQQEKLMNSEDIHGRPMKTEIISKFMFENYGIDLGQVNDLIQDEFGENSKEYLRGLRKRYLEQGD